MKMQVTMNTKTKPPEMARNSYETATCSALMGVWLFKQGERFERNNSRDDHVQVCLGDREWVQCRKGLAQVISVLEETTNGRLADLPDDWGVVASPEGEILYRATTQSRLHEVIFLGHQNGPLETRKATIQEVGIGPVKR